MRRPLPPIPRLARPRTIAHGDTLLACPRVAPDWELAAVQALIRPQRRDAILHRSANQSLPAGYRTRAERIVQAVAERIGWRPEIHWPIDGDYHFAAQIPAAEFSEAKALAIALSRELPGVWLVLGRLFIRDGRFHSRVRRVGLELAPTARVRLSRPLRTALKGIVP